MNLFWNNDKILNICSWSKHKTFTTVIFIKYLYNTVSNKLLMIKNKTKRFNFMDPDKITLEII